LSWIFRGILITFIGVTDWRTLLASYGKNVGTDVIIVMLSWIVANILRFSSIPPESDFTGFIFGLWVIPLVLITGLTFSGCYRNLSVADFGFADAIRLISATSISWICAFLAILVFEFRTISFYLLPIGWLVLLPALTVPRIWLRLQFGEKTDSSQTTKAS
jgi:FlaA1/EpsC-like NDP-sugar epimerase